jgi:hypothetical protein
MDVTPRLDKLERLGAKLDAADKSGGSEWAGLFDEYEALATARALATRPPKIIINSVADFWTANTLLHSNARRADALAADLENPERHGLRANIDVRAALALAKRDRMVIYEAIADYKAKQEAGKQRAKAIAKARRQRVRAIAKAIHSAIGRIAP